MSKFIFFICAILLAGALANALESQNVNKEEGHSLVKQILDKVVSIIDEASDQVSERAIFYQLLATEANKLIKEGAENTTKAVFDKIQEARIWVKSEVDEAVKEAVNYNVTECAEMTEAFENTAVEATAEVSQCVNEVTNKAADYAENIKHSSETMQKNLTDIKTEAELCVKDVNGLLSGARALLCVKIAAAKGTWVVTKNVPAFLVDMGRLAWKLTTAKIKLEECKTVNSSEKINENSYNVVEKVKQCIKARKELAQAQRKSE